MTLPAGCGHVSPNTTPRKRTCEPWGDGCDATGVRWPITPIKTASFARQVLRGLRTTPGRSRGALPVRTGTWRTADRMDRGTKSAGERAHRAIVRDPPGPPGEGNAFGGNR